MDIPVAFRWAIVALAVLQLTALVPVVRRMRRPDPAVRTDARLDLFDVIASLTLLAGVGLENAPLLLVGFALLGAVITVKGFRALRRHQRT
ncbi:hypothetical protein [Streptomyces sp. Qhu_M48]|uniref:hypothetical protein n=1 Tax=Streptomyces sp. Qhu_M48 TaxID=3435889 RepID=UPI003F4F716A